MPTTEFHDPWLAPTRQREFPLRDVLAVERLHGRREASFLLLATLFVGATVAMVMLGAGRVLDLGGVVARFAPSLELPIPLEVPVGALAFPMTLFAAALVRELYGSRRSTMLVIAGAIAVVGATWLSYIAAADELVVIAWSAAFGAAYLIGHFVHGVIFGALHNIGSGHRWLRKTLAMIMAHAAAWAVYGLVSFLAASDLLGQRESFAAGQATTLALGAAAYGLAFGLIDLIPFVALARLLAVYLRVDHRGLDTELDDELYDRRLPPALIVDDPPRRARRPTLPSFTTAELRFFTEGDEWNAAADSGTSRTDLARA
ncbi:MAG: VUT family protein [Kofleriaceae bacterium]